MAQTTIEAKKSDGAMRSKIEDFIYKKVIRSLMLTSKLGRQSVLGEAATGYNFDHMYENKPQGFNLIGGLIDRVLLNLPAVRATRNRRRNVVKILSNEIENHRMESKTTKIIDLACGTGRYLSDVTSTFRGEKVEIVGVDYDRKSLQLGQELAQKHNIPEANVRFVKGNIFRLRLLKRFGRNIDWRPNIVVASGLTVYIDDEKVLEMLRQVYEGLDKGGLFLFDSQENNPSRKLMEKLGTTREGPWVLFYRPPSVWRKWLSDFGYTNIVVSSDPWRMYNLCTARKS